MNLWTRFAVVTAFSAVVVSSAAWWIAGCAAPTTPTTRTLTVGVLAPKTGSLSKHGAALDAALAVATEEINAFFTSSAATTRIQLRVVDTDSTADGAFEALRDLADDGIHSAVGPYGSDQIGALISLSDRLRTLLLAPYGGDVSLAVDDDNVLRFVPDQQIVVEATAELLFEADIRKVAFLSRGGAEANSLRDALSTRITAHGGTLLGTVGVAEDALAANDFRNPLTELAALLNSNGADQDSNGIGVVLLLNEEAASVLAQAGPFQNLDHVRWFGNEIAARSEAVTSNADAAAFAATVAFSAPLFLLPADSARTDAVLQAVTQRLGTSPDPYALVAYDALWAIGLTANEVASPNDAAVLRFSLPEVVSFYNGASGVIALNAAGDRTTATYEIVQVSPTETGPAWTRAATFADGVLTPQASASDAP